jgi:hypothetical protein
LRRAMGSGALEPGCTISLCSHGETFSAAKVFGEEGSEVGRRASVSTIG